MNLAYLLIGGNLGDRNKNLVTSRQLIARHCGTITHASSVYETAAWGNSEQPSFLNQALEMNTELTARQLMRALLKIERSMGRVREEKYGPRLIDIDLLLFNQEIHHYQFLELPHPQMQFRRFVLLPLDEIAADIIHPVLHKTIHELLMECTDPLAVDRL